MPAATAMMSMNNMSMNNMLKFPLGEVVGSGMPMYYFTLVYVVGFVAAVAIGSIAWYNSKRPAGWEDVDRPSFIPKMDKDSEDDKTTP